MECFQLVKSVLDEIYADLPDRSERSKDRKIQEKLDILQERYGNLLSSNISVDYSDLYTQFAYIYRYVTSHANIVYQVIQTYPEIQELLSQEKISVACLGGGPGSDLLGILKYVMKYKLTPTLRCTNFDKETCWGECWNDVDDKVGAGMRLSTSFLPLDVTDPETYMNQKKYLRSDLFTLIYFMSEVYSKREEAELYFSILFDGIKKGALVLYVDNSDSRFYEWFDSLANANNLEFIRKEETSFNITDFREEKTDLAEYYEKFGMPKLTAKASLRICQKE